MIETKWTAQILLQSNRLTRVEFFSPSNLREKIGEPIPLKGESLPLVECDLTKYEK